jgi:hypothetical protein
MYSLVCLIELLSELLMAMDVQSLLFNQTRLSDALVLDTT